MLLQAAISALFLSKFPVLAHDNGVALTPPMGWNTYNHFGCDISEDIVTTAAQALVDSGLKNFGYEYVNMDDCWQAPARDPSTGAPIPDPNKFPSGIKALADKIHGLGLKIGIYSDAGTMTCGGRFGSLDKEEIDAKTYASWGIDYVKYDNCFNEGRAGYNLVSFDRYANMSRALNATGRPMVYSMCNWGEDGPWNWAQTIANSWRISGDIMDEFSRFDDRCPCLSFLDCKYAGFHCAMARIIDFAAPLGGKAGINHWNDLDILTVGLGGMNHDEYVTHFSFWCILKSVLLLGHDLSSQTNETLEIVTNTALINISQDAFGTPANRVWRKMLDEGDLSVWQGPLSDGSSVVAVLNTSPQNQTLTPTFSQIFVDSRQAQALTYEFFDLWQKNSNETWGKSIGMFSNTLSNVAVVTHGTRVFKAVPQAQKDRGTSEKAFLV